MLKGLYEAAVSMKARAATQDVIAHNLANANTSGFQREMAAVQSRMVPPTAARPGAAPVEALVPVSSTDTHAGILHRTGLSTDVALEGPGYLTVKTGSGTRLFRGGPLRANTQGELSTMNGDPLLGQDGNPIKVGTQSWTIAPDGTVSAGGKRLGQLRVALPVGAVKHEGDLLQSAGALKDAPAGTTHVLQEFQESSNVEPVREMVDMISGMRAYESAQKAVQAHDETLQSLTDLLRPR